MAARTSNKKRKPSGGLTKWFKEEWVDLKTGKNVEESPLRTVSDLTLLAVLKQLQRK